jgi:hypothetical protein
MLGWCWQPVSGFLFLVPGGNGLANIKLQKLSFLQIPQSEMVGNGVEILAKSDGGIAGFVG